VLIRKNEKTFTLPSFCNAFPIQKSTGTHFLSPVGTSLHTVHRPAVVSNQAACTMIQKKTNGRLKKADKKQNDKLQLNVRIN